MWHRFVFVLIILSLLPTSIFAFTDEEEAIVRMIDPIDSDVNKVGETFQATLEAPLKIGDNTVALKGAPATVQLVHVKQSGHFRGQEELALQLRSITLEGDTYLVNSQFAKVASEGKGKETATVVGGAAAIGAIVGAITGGKKGTLIGAATGAGVGAAIQLVRGKRVHLPSESVLSFKLEGPISPNDSRGTGAGIGSYVPKQKPKRIDKPENKGPEEAYVFSERDESIIRDWFSNKKNRKGLPPGLAKRKRLPAGLQRQLQKNGTLPPGLQKHLQAFPLNLERTLPSLPHNVRRGLIGVDAVLFDETSNKILDIVQQVLS